MVARAAPGDLDPTFGTGGVVTPGFGTIAHAVAIQRDGRIIVVGEAGHGSTARWALARFNADGSLDGTFGTAGTVTTLIGTACSGMAVALEANGKIVMAGNATDGRSYTFALGRYEIDGSLDAGFGIGGTVTTPIGPNAFAYGLALQSDGKIIAVGNTSNLSNFFASALARYSADGSLDLGFGTGGTVTGPTGSAGGFQAVAVQSDGRIVAAGGSGQFALTRYNPADGSLDNTFGTGGMVTTPIGTAAYAEGVALQADGKITVAGYTRTQFALARYDSDGNLDPGFGTGGTVTSTLKGQFDEALALVLQSDGKIVAVGNTFTNSSAAVVARYNTDGSLDTGFGVGGRVITTTGLQSGAAVALQEDGKIVVVGYGDGGFAVARYLNDDRCGDVNGDGSVNVGDALLVAQYDVGLRGCVERFNGTCDVNDDGACDIGDALRIAQCDVGLVSCTFTCSLYVCP